MVRGVRFSPDLVVVVGVGEHPEPPGGRRGRAAGEADVGVVAVLARVPARLADGVRDAVVSDVAEQRRRRVDHARAGAQPHVEQRVDAFAAVVEIGGARRGRDPVEVDVRLVDPAHAGVDPECELAGAGVAQIVGAETGLAVVGRPVRIVDHVVVGVGLEALGEPEAQGRLQFVRHRQRCRREGHPLLGAGGGSRGGAQQRQGGEGGAAHGRPHSKRRRSGTRSTSPSRSVIIDSIAPPRSTALKLKRYSRSWPVEVGAAQLDALGRREAVEPARERDRLQERGARLDLDHAGGRDLAHHVDREGAVGLVDRDHRDEDAGTDREVRGQPVGDGALDRLDRASGGTDRAGERHRDAAVGQHQELTVQRVVLEHGDRELVTRLDSVAGTLGHRQRRRHQDGQRGEQSLSHRSCLWFLLFRSF